MINAIANGALCTAMVLFYIVLFGNENNVINKWKSVNHWTLRVAVCGVIGASAWNAVNFTAVVPLGETVLNLFLAALFTWAFYFHRYHFNGNK